MKFDVAIVIVAYNSEEQIEACLESVFEQREHVSQQVIVLDNGPVAGTANIVREKFPLVEVIVPDRNLGFAAGCNAAVARVEADYVLLLNPDTVILNHAVDVVVDFARNHPEYGLCGGRAFRPDGQLERSSCWGAASLWSTLMFATGLSTVFKTNALLDPESLGKWPRDTVREVGVITGCFLLAETSIWNQLGGFDESFFMYGEDQDLCERARGIGFRPVICPDATYVHEVGQSSATRLDKALLLFKGKTSYIRRHWTGLRQRMGLDFLVMGVLLRSLGERIRNRRQEDASWTGLWRQRRDWVKGYPLNESRSTTAEGQPRVAA